MFAALGLRRWGGVWGSPGVQKLGVLGVGASGSQAVLRGGGPCSQSAVPNIQTYCPPHQEGKGPDVQARFPIQAPAEGGKLELTGGPQGSQCLQGFQNSSSRKS